MKHFVAISLVFFSLTHLAKAERIENLRALSERYCNETRINSDSTVNAGNQQSDQHHPFFLSYHELTLIGTKPIVKGLKFTSTNQVIGDLIVRKKPKNNSP